MVPWDELAHPREVEIPLSSGCPSLSLTLMSFDTVASPETLSLVRLLLHDETLKLKRKMRKIMI